MLLYIQPVKAKLSLVSIATFVRLRQHRQSSDTIIVKNCHTSILRSINVFHTCHCQTLLMSYVCPHHCRCLLSGCNRLDEPFECACVTIFKWPIQHVLNAVDAVACINILIYWTILTLRNYIQAVRIPTKILILWTYDTAIWYALNLFFLTSRFYLRTIRIWASNTGILLKCENF